LKVLRDLVENRQDILMHRLESGAVPQSFEFEEFANHQFHFGDITSHARLHASIVDQLKGNLQPRQGRSQLMTDVQQQLIARADHVLDAAHHTIKGVREYAELVAGTFRHDDVEMALAQPCDTVAEQPNWQKQPLQHAVTCEYHHRHEQQ